MYSLEGQRSDSRLLSFLHREADKHISFFALVIVFYARSHSGIQKTVRLVQALHGLRICIHEPPAEPSGRTKGPLEDLQPALQQFRVEVFVPGNLDSHKFVLCAAFNGVSNRSEGSLPADAFQDV